MTKAKILVTSPLPDTAVDELKSLADLDVSPLPLKPHQLKSRLSGCDAVVAILEDQFTQDVMLSCPGLKLIANVAVGYDNIDIAAANSLGILVTNTPGVLDETTADLAFGLLIACARRITEADCFVRAGRWQGWSPDLMLGVDIHGKTLGIIGMGRIGKAIARRAFGFGMQVLYTTGRRQGELAQGMKPVDLEELLSQSDFVSVNCPLNEATTHLIGKRELALVKPGAVLINTARGAIIDQDALVAALVEGRLSGAGLDVFEGEPHVPASLCAMNNVVLTPHVGSATKETRQAMAFLAVRAVKSLLAGKLPANAVNPEVWPRLQAKL